MSAVWAVHPDAPASTKADTDQGATLVLGRPVRDDTDQTVNADNLQAVWPVAPGPVPPLPLGGFFAALNYDTLEGLVAGVDLLGIFPLYYWYQDEVLLIASSSQLFKGHPLFHAAFNPEALTGILLTTHLTDGETLWRGVRRLQPGHILRWQPGQEPVEQEYFRLPVSRRYFDLPFSAQVELLDESIEKAVQRHVPPEFEHALFLSGGLDSRMLGGYLKRNSRRTVGFTMGDPRDNELKCAREVAATLGIPLRIAELDTSRFSEFADLQVKWEHLATGFSTIHSWGIPDLMQSLASRSVTGYMLDAVVGTHYMTWAYSAGTRDMSYAHFFQHLNEYGLAPESLQRLLRPEVFGDSIQTVQDRLREDYESYSDLETQRAWCFNLAHRQRFHVGPVLWRLSFGAWPSVPVLDRQLLECAGGMPAATIAERRGQQEVLCQRFPELARIPLDRNSADVKALQPRLRHLLKEHALAHLRPVRRLKKRMLPDSHEARRYYRLYDFNGPHWRTVRQAAEPGRERLLEFFRADQLDKILPPPGVPVECERAIARTSGLKLLIGFMLWAAAQD